LTAWFADASVVIAGADADDREHDAARSLLSGTASIATLDLAYYEVTNVAVRAWRDPSKARKLRAAVAAIARDGGLIRVDEALATAAAELAEQHGLSAYDAAYLAGAAVAGARLVSCDVRDLVGSGLAVTPGQAVAV
jgi:predicted nucleic acid-binding protein